MSSGRRRDRPRPEDGPSTGTGPSTVARSGSRRQRQQVVDVVGTRPPARRRARRAAGAAPRARPARAARTRPGRGARRPARAPAPRRRAARRRRPRWRAARGSRPRSSGARLSSAARRSGRSSMSRPSSSSAAAYPPSARGSAPGVATTRAGRASTVSSTPAPPRVAARRADGHPGERAAELLRRTPLPHRRGPQPLPAAPGAAPVAGDPPAPAADRRRVPARDAERPVAVHAAGRLAAGLAGQPRHVAAARHLHQHRAALERRLRGLPRHVRQPGRRGPPRRGRGRSSEPEARTRGASRRTSARGATTSRAQPVRDEAWAPRPSARSTRAREPAPVERGAQGEHLAGVPVRRVRLGEAVVAVVPQHDEPEVGDRGEHRGTGADDHAHGARGGPRGTRGSAPRGRGRR